MKEPEYKIQASGGRRGSVLRARDGASIPFSVDNTDFARFVEHWKGGGLVHDEKGHALHYSDQALKHLMNPPPPPPPGEEKKRR